VLGLERFHFNASPSWAVWGPDTCFTEIADGRCEVGAPLRPGRFKSQAGNYLTELGSHSITTELRDSALTLSP
jgi:hypothetical protein